MIEVTGNFWKIPADIKCITTNGDIARDGHAIMGAGVAAQSRVFNPKIQENFGLILKQYGLHCYIIEFNFANKGFDLWSFPVKYHYWQKADVDLIAQSAQELASIYLNKQDTILIPRPGCGNGGLEWENVKPIIEPILSSDNFMVVGPVVSTKM